MAYANVESADGYVMNHGWTLYVFDAAMMVVDLTVSIRTYNLFKESHGRGKLLQETPLEKYAQLSAYLEHDGMNRR